MEQSSVLNPSIILALRQQLRGITLLPGDAEYGLARRVWNAAIDRRPAAIVQCADGEDVALALRVAAERGVAVTVRGGGHNVAGRAVAEGALTLDLSRMRDVTVNADARIATVQGGAQWHDVDVITARHGLVTTGGLVSSTGVGGFTLGGGTGWLMRQHGLAIDNLLAAGVVLSDGRIVRASPEDHAELFWGLRGGGGHLGVVTNFEFRLHPLRQVLAGVVIRPLTEARTALRTFSDFAAQAPDCFCGMAVLAHAPPLPFLDAAWHGQPVLVVALCWCADIQAGERALAPLRQSGSPLADHVGPMPYVQWQHLQDSSAPAGRLHYWKTASYASFSDATIDVLCGAAERLPSRWTEIHVQHMGGAVARIPAADTAFAQRDAQFFVNLIGVTAWPDEFAQLRESVRRLHAQIAPAALSHRLPNFSDQDDGDPTTAPDAPGASRLSILRRNYDPAGLFVRS
jgi:FAD/FMN-containing dehydrogenase